MKRRQRVNEAPGEQVLNQHGPRFFNGGSQLSIGDLEELYRGANVVKTAVSIAQRLLYGQQVRLLVGKYADRLGYISGVIPDYREGLLACVMVIRSGCEEKIENWGWPDTLNSDGETRQYWPLSSMALTGRRYKELT